MPSANSVGRRVESRREPGWWCADDNVANFQQYVTATVFPPNSGRRISLPATKSRRQLPITAKTMRLLKVRRTNACCGPSEATRNLAHRGGKSKDGRVLRQYSFGTTTIRRKTASAVGVSSKQPMMSFTHFDSRAKVTANARCHSIVRFASYRRRNRDHSYAHRLEDAPRHSSRRRR